MRTMTEIGFVGLGAMGTPMAERLVRGHRMTGTNRTRAKAQPLVDRGMAWRDTPREVAASSAVVFSMVTDDDALAAITAGPDGIVAGLRPGAVYVDMSTVSPAASRAVAARVRAAGAMMLDAPVSGSVPAARNGTLTIMVGGPEAAFETAEPLLRLLGGSVTRIGDNGQGLLLKLAINISLAAQMLAFSEGVVLAQRGGIDPGLAVKVMTASAIGSPMLHARAPLVLDPPDEAWFDMRRMHKDIRLVLEAAEELHALVPTAEAADRALRLADELGLGNRDIAQFSEVLARSAGAAAAAR